jgi:uncharacterized protein (DUF58 family)
MRRPLPRPERAAGPVAGTVASLGIFAAVAHSSGSGWVQALGALLAGFLLVGLGGPALALRRARCAVVEAPLDAVAGAPVPLVVSTNIPVRVLPLSPAGSQAVLDPRAPRKVTVVAAYHCELEAVAVRVASAAPFGLLWWSVDVVLPLPRPILVAPRPGLPDSDVVAQAGRADAAAGPVPARSGETRGIRAYRPGDLRHLVHWPATAHAGTMMVREMEVPGRRPASVRVDLPADPDAAERLLETVLGTLGHLLSRGREVELTTLEHAGERHGPVTGVRDAGRRLARAIAPGPRPGGAQEGAGGALPR